ncbi:unnamed protein product [Linum trigynum]|uniref:VQ domain-containing protein n=1 Tax=Linum trigynum TaxID=586398 RepID=A0AAV2EX27_9ROSI
MDNHQPPPPPATAAADSSAGNSSRDQYLKSLNKLSHKISKPTIPKKPFDHPPNNDDNNNDFNPPPPMPPASSQPPQSQNQPPVYNINKSDFRDVVQKLTGSPAHERFSAPPPIHAPKPQSSRLQRIRPPPLAHLTNRPPPIINNPSDVSSLPPQPFNPAAAQGFLHRPPAPMSPLPPFPAVHAAAESPVSAYMRYLHNSVPNFDPNNKQFSGFSPLAPLVSPRWNSNSALPPPPPPPPQQQQGVLPSPTSHPQFQLPLSPLPFGCLNSPRSSYPLLSPTAFPLSPTVPVPSPRWKGL